MRAEDRELEGPDLERQEETRDQAAHEQEELPALGGEELRDLELAHRSTLFDAIRLVLAGENVTVSLLYLPQRETHALEALQAAVNGQDSVGEFVFADDRKALLEQALAVLQQNVTHGDPEQLAELHAKFEELTAQVSELRTRLVSLGDAQDDLFDEKRQYGQEEVADEGDRDDQPRPAEDARLDGPERPAPPPAPSTLYGEAPPAPPPAPSTLEGPERPAAPAEPSTLDADELADEPRPRPRSELAADAEAAEAEKPWWRRPFG